jgi:predicted lipoprotein
MVEVDGEGVARVEVGSSMLGDAMRSGTSGTYEGKVALDE